WLACAFLFPDRELNPAGRSSLCKRDALAQLAGWEFSQPVAATRRPRFLQTRPPNTSRGLGRPDARSSRRSIAQRTQLRVRSRSRCWHESRNAIGPTPPRPIVLRGEG